MSVQGMALVVIDRHHPDGELLRVAYDEVLEPSFPPEELSSFDDLGSSLEAFGLAIVALDDGRVIGIGISETDAIQRIGLLSYLATQPGARGRGVGATLLRALRERWTDQPVDVVLGEVEDPRVHRETEDNLTGARLRFYERNGCDLLGVPWTQPGLDGGLRVPGLLLVRCWYRASAAPLRSRALAAWAEAYYIAEEGHVPDDDEYRTLRARLTPDAEVPVLAIANLEQALPIDR